MPCLFARFLLEKPPYRARYRGERLYPSHGCRAPSSGYPPDFDRLPARYPRSASPCIPGLELAAAADTARRLRRRRSKSGGSALPRSPDDGARDDCPSRHSGAGAWVPVGLSDCHCGEPQMRAQALIILATFASLAGAAAAEETVETTDGRRILLRDDGRYEILPAGPAAAPGRCPPGGAVRPSRAAAGRGGTPPATRSRSSWPASLPLAGRGSPQAGGTTRATPRRSARRRCARTCASSRSRAG